MNKRYLNTALIVPVFLASMSVGAQQDGPLVGLEYLEQVNQRIHNIGTAELEALIAEESALVVIDVRHESEVNARGGMIDARREIIVPRGWIEFRMPNEVPDLDTPIVVYCGINQRSPLAAETLKQMGYTRVSNYAPGFFEWRDAGKPVKFTDRALDSMLFRKPEKVVDGVWSAIGATSPGSYANSGHNNNLSFVIGESGVLVFNAGDNYLLARALHDEIRKITSLPVTAVALENGQGHSMLGSNYWQEQGVPVIAHVDTAAWIDTWERFAALGAKQVIPGHGDPTDMAEVTRFTRDYLVHLREKIGEVIDEGGDLQQAYGVDQSPYEYLDTFYELAIPNADRVFRAMEFE